MSKWDLGSYGLPNPEVEDSACLLEGLLSLGKSDKDWEQARGDVCPS